MIALAPSVARELLTENDLLKIEVESLKRQLYMAANIAQGLAKPWR